MIPPNRRKLSVLDVPAVVREEGARGGWRVEDYEKSLVLLRHGFAHLTTEGKRKTRRGDGGRRRRACNESRSSDRRGTVKRNQAL